MSLNPSARHPVYKNKYNPTPSETTPHNSSSRAPIKKKKKKKSKSGGIDSTSEQIQRNHINRLQSRIARGRPPHRPPPGYTCSPAPALSLGWATAGVTRGAFAARSPPGPPVRLGTPGSPGVLPLKHSAQAPHLPAHLPSQARDRSDPSPHSAASTPPLTRQLGAGQGDAARASRASEGSRRDGPVARSVPGPAGRSERPPEEEVAAREKRSSRHAHSGTDGRRVCPTARAAGCRGRAF